MFRRFSATLLILVLTVSCAGSKPAPQRDPASEKPFKTAVVISGENMNTPLFIGMLDGLKAAGKDFDLIVSSCGASIASAFYQAVPDREKRLEYLTSKDYFEMLRGLQMDDPSLTAFGKRLWKLRKVAKRQEQIDKTGKRFMVDVFSYSLLRLKDEVTSAAGFHLSQNFSNEAPHVVIVAGRVDYDPSEAGGYTEASRKLFTETYFTDPSTGHYLEGFPSLVGTGVPASSLSPQTQLVTDAQLGEAVRASITDPLLVNTVPFRGNYYLTGAVNIDPVNVAQHLASEVIFRHPVLYDDIETIALGATFAFDGNAVRSQVLGSKVDYWIDGTTEFPSYGLGPRPNLWGAMKRLSPGRTYKFGSKVPEKFEDFVKLVRAQYQFGFERAQEALRMERYSKDHIRKKQ